MENRLGEYIQQRRKEMGLSLRELGKLCGISHTHIDSIEKGIDYRTGKRVNVTNETFRKLSEVLKVPAAYLLELSLDGNIDSPAQGFPFEGAYAVLMGKGAHGGQEVRELTEEQYQKIKKILEIIDSEEP